MQYKELIEKDGSLLKSIKYDFIRKKRKKKKVAILSPQLMLIN